MRLVMLGPLGAPIFTLAANADEAMLLLSREERVVRDPRADQILGALTGMTIAPADLQAILTGCVVPSPRAVAGRLHGNGMASIDLEGGTVLYLQRAGDAWRVRAARRADWIVEYLTWPAASLFPTRVRLQSEMPVAVDVTAGVSQIVTNTDLDDAAFTLQIPRDARPLSLEELRESGPLRGQR